MSQRANLTNSSINLAAIRDHTKNEVIACLDSLAGKKDLILDPQLTGPLGLMVEAATLKEHGVEKIRHLQMAKLPLDTKNVMCLVRPNILNMKMIAQQIRLHESNDPQNSKNFSVFFVPRKTMICERILEEEGVYGDITIGELKMDLVPCDDDLISLELDSAFRECYLDGDGTSLHYVARALMKLQTTFGIIPNIKGKGNCSKIVCDMLLRMQRELGPDEISVAPEIDTLILIDRDVDLVTPMMTQLTYEGLVDEIFKIKHTYVDLPPEILGQTGDKKKSKLP
eukprot:gnl/Hemi2/419_TR141_c0_g2_i1.p2 gnl/Hemi2/419_TR141_c0_g2~~gnl/Hemi2/419_TR141_c0_g2_i1.p2  ORF type:complete len:283 (+),score=88.25 gnl/Hemi2/419_TR141_c0_g2_i1:147-995(+)